jgi:hypothetical protein
MHQRQIGLIILGRTLHAASMPCHRTVMIGAFAGLGKGREIPQFGHDLSLTPPHCGSIVQSLPPVAGNWADRAPKPEGPIASLPHLS